jgi:nicotinate-nucleotide pyrophosphorylase (carboxylating)
MTLEPRRSDSGRNEPDARYPRTFTPMNGTPAVRREEGVLFPLDDKSLATLVRQALDEDQAFDDVTTIATVVSTRRSRATMVARDAGVVCGTAIAIEAFRQLDSKVSARVDAEDGTWVPEASPVLFLTGAARGLLSAERVALNFMMHLSGVATKTRKFVEAVKGTGVQILDTRKTLPGWRKLEKYAVRCGGGMNHRLDLSSAVLIKDNHLNALDGDVKVAVRRARETARPGSKVEIECDRIEQVEAAIEAGADIILLDNMAPDLMRRCVELVNKRAILEASGGIRLDNVRAVAETGVDWISVGALTHSAAAMNLALDFE